MPQPIPTEIVRKETEFITIDVTKGSAMVVMVALRLKMSPSLKIMALCSFAN